MIFIAHRINTIKELNTIPKEYGIEIDIRDNKNELILVHDPFTNGENLDEFLKHYDKSFIILNIKSERIEFKVIELLKKYNITEYFFLDSTIPMIYQLHNIHENNIAVRFSEFESIESVEKIKNMVKWVWIDCFTMFPLDKNIYKKIRELGLKICLVSPELQNHDIKMINQIKIIIKENKFEIDAICSKIYNYNNWI